MALARALIDGGEDVERDCPAAVDLLRAAAAAGDAEAEIELGRGFNTTTFVQLSMLTT